MMLRGLAWKDELEVFSGGENNTINLWRIGQEEPLQTVTSPGSEVKEMAFNLKMNILAFTLVSAPTVSLWKTDDLPLQNGPMPRTPPRILD